MAYFGNTTRLEAGGDRLLLRRIADRIDQALLIGLFAWFCIRLMPHGALPARWYPLMLLVSEGVVLFFVLTRKSTENISLSAGDWLIALAGTVTVMLVQNTGRPFLPVAGFVVILAGFMIHFGAKLSLRRSFGIMPADRGVKTSGFYAIVRHPMYGGYMISHLGFLIAAPTLWNMSVYAAAWALFLARIIREENLLRRNPAYEAYAARIRYRIVPGLF